MYGFVRHELFTVAGAVLLHGVNRSEYAESQREKTHTRSSGYHLPYQGVHFGCTFKLFHYPLNIAFIVEKRLDVIEPHNK